MRSATYDHKQVRLPNASLFAYGRGTARTGDLITYNETVADRLGAKNASSQSEMDRYYARTRIARVIARIKHAPRINASNPEHDSPAIDNWLCVLALSERGTSAYIRWIDPAQVSECVRMSDIPNAHLFAQMFFAQKLPFDHEQLIRLAHHGSLSAHFYTESHARDVIAEQNERIEDYADRHSTNAIERDRILAELQGKLITQS